MREKLKSMMLALDRACPYSVYKLNKNGEDGCGEEGCECVSNRCVIEEWIIECEEDEDTREIMLMLLRKYYEFEHIKLESELWKK